MPQKNSIDFRFINTWLALRVSLMKLTVVSLYRVLYNAMAEVL